MSNEELAQQLKRIAQIATLAGINGTADAKRGYFKANFVTGENRSQLLHVRPSMRTREGQQVVTFMSPCRVVKSGFLKGLSKDEALELLRMNERIPFARFGIWSSDGEDMIVATVDHLLDTLDAAEFHNHAWAVAQSADAYEQKHGGDAF